MGDRNVMRQAVADDEGVVRCALCAAPGHHAITVGASSLAMRP
jgi:hypothetical protein